MDELRSRLRAAGLSNWAYWPTVRGLWPWFAALGLVMVLAVPWGIRAEERSLEAASRDALATAGFAVEDVTFVGRQATITASLSTNEQIEAVQVLADMGGVARVTWKEASRHFVTPISVPPTTTEPSEPGAQITATAADGRITLRGVVPTAQTIKDLTDAASGIWGKAVVNQLFVDGSALPHGWLGMADEAIAVLATLIDPQLSLDYDGATLTGGAISQSVLDDALSRLSESLGEDTVIDNKVRVTRLDLPNVQLVSPERGTAEIRGTVADAAVRRAIVAAVNATGEEVALSGGLDVSQTTANVYVVHRLPEVISLLGASSQWTLQFDGESLGGTAMGGKTFVGNRPRTTAHVVELLGVFASIMQAHPHLDISIEIHVAPRENDTDIEQLAQNRADAMATHLVRLGVDPERITAARGPGEGELLRFTLVPAER